jgi:transposase
LQNTCGRHLSKRGLEAAGIGRSKGGLTTKIHVAVDAPGLPLRVTITPGQASDSPQAQGLIEGLSDSTRVIMDAAYDTDHLLDCIANDLGATAHIKCNPSRSSKPPIDWTLYKERYLVACFFNKRKRFRRIALRCKNTVSSFEAFIHLACAMTWLS